MGHMASVLHGVLHLEVHVNGIAAARDTDTLLIALN